jgi:hypothetical protein
MAKTTNPPPQPGDAQAANAKFAQTGLFAGIVGELNLNQDQLLKRQNLIRKIIVLDAVG